MALALLTGISVSFAQKKQIGGMVTDPNGDPLAGVTVVVKGTQTGTSTNANGKFTITASVGQTLLFSYLGMDSQEIKVGSASRLNVQLKETTAQIEDLVVIGYGAVQRKDVIQEQSLKFHRTTCWPLPPPT